MKGNTTVPFGDAVLEDDPNFGKIFTLLNCAVWDYDLTFHFIANDVVRAFFFVL
jgi:hypothetical protein